MKRWVSGPGAKISPAVTYDEDCHEAGQCGVPVAAGCGRGFSHQHAVEDEVSQPQLHAP